MTEILPGIWIISWDWREQIPLDELDKAIYNLTATGQPIRVRQVETGSQAYAIAISAGHEPADDATCNAAWDKYESEVGW